MPPVLLILTPGWDLEAYVPLIRALRDGGSEVGIVTFPCSGGLDDALARVRRAQGAEETVVVAHGLGATLALLAGLPHRHVLLAPVLDVWPVEDTRALAALPVDVAVDLSAGHPDLLGGTPPLGCVAPRLAQTVQGWIREGMDLPLETVDAHVWIGVGLLDQVAAVEAVVPASRRLPRRELVRLGITRLDPRDYGHVDLLVDPVPIRAAVRAVQDRSMGAAP